MDEIQQCVEAAVRGEIATFDKLLRALWDGYHRNVLKEYIKQQDKTGEFDPRVINRFQSMPYASSTMISCTRRNC